MLRRSWIVLLVLLGALVGTVTRALAMGTPDQLQFVTDTALPFGSSLQLVQTFVPSLSGPLDTVSLVVSQGPGGGDLVVQIYSVQQGRLGGSPLASQTVQRVTIGASLARLDVAFASPAQVTAGSTYALVLSSTSTGGAADFFSAATGTNAYPTGQLYTAPRAAGPLTPQQGALVFVTYVTGGSSGGGGSAVGNVCTCGHAPSNPFPTRR